MRNDLFFFGFLKTDLKFKTRKSRDRNYHLPIGSTNRVPNEKIEIEKEQRVYQSTKEQGLNSLRKGEKGLMALSV